tara:strand:+ start:150 stop:875 length:726 start_codon:yes stop_codon:yes gene_type:complete
MADYRQIIPMFKEKEGGLSKATTDTQSKNPSPCTHNGLTGVWHTNKGVAYSTFKSLAPKLGYEASCKNFLEMPTEIWGKVFKNGFWDIWGLDNMKSQPIANTIVWWSWGSGNGGATTSFKKFLSNKGINVSSRSEIVRELDKLAEIDDNKLFDELTAHRLNFYATRSTAKANLRGWTNSYNRFTTFMKGYLGKAKEYGAEGVAKSFAKDPIKFAKRNWIPITVLSVVFVGIGFLVVRRIWK